MSEKLSSGELYRRVLSAVEGSDAEPYLEELYRMYNECQRRPDPILGRTGRDVASGFTGVIVAAADYLSTGSKYCLQPRVGQDGKLPEGKWFDEGRVEIVEERPEIPERPAIEPTDRA